MILVPVRLIPWLALWFGVGSALNQFMPEDGAIFIGIGVTLAAWIVWRFLLRERVLDFDLGRLTR
jgi:hypothetical protein